MTKPLNRKLMTLSTLIIVKIRERIQRFINGFFRLIGFSIGRIEPRPVWPGEASRYEYQKLFQDFNIQKGEIVLDIGSGGYPFPYATFLTDRYIEPTHHRDAKLVLDGKPFLVSDIERLPFPNKALDFIYCSHIFEHVENPIAACAEIVRVGKRGYIETPTLAKDMLFSWAKGMHRWHLISIADKLIFFEYSERQLEGVRSSAWNDLIFGKIYHPMQALFFNNQDLFNVMFFWQGSFNCHVYYLDGRVEERRF